MADRSLISWTDTTWNPITGCTRVSEGCRRCYIDRTPPFRMAGRRFDGVGIGAGTGVLLHPERLAQPLHWRKPRRVFVNSLSDLFHDDVPDEFLARMFAVMAATPQHTYQVLTKRPARMRSFLVDQCRCGAGHPAGAHLLSAMSWAATPHNPDYVPGLTTDAVRDGSAGYTFGRPLPNVWLGVSTEDQRTADQRIPILLDTPAAVRWISAEPLLGPVRLDRWVRMPDGVHRQPIDWLHWVVVGGESGPGARPMHPEWARSLRDQCADASAAGVPFHFKQWGEWIPEAMKSSERGAITALYLEDDGTTRPAARGARGDAITVQRLGKKAAGRVLDGRTWDEYPAAVASSRPATTVHLPEPTEEV